MDPAPTHTRWRTLLGWSACAAMAAGMLVWALVIAMAFIDEGSRYGWTNGLLGYWGAAIWAVTLGGMAFGLVMTVPVYLASLWAVPRKLGGAFAIGAVAVLLGGFRLVSLQMVFATFPLFCATIAVATGLGGVFFVTRIDHWTWTEPCAS